MAEYRIVAATGMLGTGYSQASLERALELKPHFIGVDSGSTDPGPCNLGGGTLHMSPEAYRRDLRHLIREGVRRGIPVVVGSAGGAGANAHVERFEQIVREIAREENLHFRLALIFAEQDRDYVRRKLAEGRTAPLPPADPLTDDLIDRAAHIVGMMGPEPIQRAIHEGAQVVIAGRSSDTSIYAALPLAAGLEPGVVWHAAKILECGAAAVERRFATDCLFAVLRDDHFVVFPLDPRMRCTPLSVAAHTLYENVSPLELVEPPGTLWTDGCRYEVFDERSVKVTGSRFVPADRYTVKLEGAELVGYQTILLAGVRDPVLIGQLDRWLAEVATRVRERAVDLYGTGLNTRAWSFTWRIYGRDGVLGALEPERHRVGHEIGLLLEITAQTQEIATAIMSAARHVALHHPVPPWESHVSNLAFPYSPPMIPRGAAYRFILNHVVEPEDPYEMFPMKLLEV